MQDHQAKQKHSAAHQVHHPSNIATTNPLNYFVKPTENSSILKHKLKLPMQLYINILKVLYQRQKTKHKTSTLTFGDGKGKRDKQLETQGRHYFWWKRNYQTLNTTTKTFSKSRQQIQGTNNEFSVIL